MTRASHLVASFFTAAFFFAMLAIAPTRLPAQSQRKSPAKPATPSSQPREDPLAPLLQQAKESIDKNDFAAAVEPLQKYIVQHSDDPFAHFQLGYANAG